MKNLYAFAFIALFLFSLFVILVANLILLLSAKPLPFFEPDNYEYLLFVNLVLQKHNMFVSNPYLIHQSMGFFEHPGLYLLPSSFAVLFHTSAVVAMHVIYSLFLVLQATLLLIII